MTEKLQLMTKKETALFIGCSQRTLDRWHIRREGPARITVGRKILYRLEAVINWLHENEIAPTRKFF